MRRSSSAIGRLSAIATKPPISSHTIAGPIRWSSAQINTALASIVIATTAPRHPIGTVTPPITRVCLGSSDHPGGRPGQLALVSAAHSMAPSTIVTNEPPIPAIAMPSPTLMT